MRSQSAAVAGEYVCGMGNRPYSRAHGDTWTMDKKDPAKRAVNVVCCNCGRWRSTFRAERRREKTAMVRTSLSGGSGECIAKDMVATCHMSARGRGTLLGRTIRTSKLGHDRKCLVRALAQSARWRQLHTAAAAGQSDGDSRGAAARPIVARRTAHRASSVVKAGAGECELRGPDGHSPRAAANAISGVF